MSQTRYANAYTEVYEILCYLNEEEFEKIPKDLIEVFEENRNLDYQYELNEEQDLLNQSMLVETKAILLNIFRDYLATPEQKLKIKEWLEKDRAYLEKQKQEKYSANVFENNKKIDNCEIKNVNKEEKSTNNLPIEIKQQSIWKRIINKIKKIFNK